MSTNQLEETLAELTVPGRGILPADESTGTIEQRFRGVNIACTEESRRDYRGMLFSTPGLGECVSGVILFEETLGQQSAKGEPLPRLLDEQGIVTGIKVDKGTVGLPGFPNEKVTQGLDGLAERLAEYKKSGARFAKWRAVFAIGAGIPSAQGIAVNAAALARYAAICQEQSLVPIVEPEVLMDGDHDIESCSSVTEKVLHAVFDALHRQRVVLELMLLKPNMVLPGLNCPRQATPEEVAGATLVCFRRTVPAAMSSINFLSGGQHEQAATANLNAMNSGSQQAPWQLSFSYGRALQAPALKVWRGEEKNRDIAQQSLFKRACLNSVACQGHYTVAMEQGPDDRK